MAKIKINTTKNVLPMIYAYTTPGVVYHDGWTKIGYTERDVKTRVAEQMGTPDIKYNLEWQDIAIFCDGKTRFTDKEFHGYLTKNKIERKPNTEWFEIDGTKSHNMFNDFRQNKGIMESLGVLAYNLREEQNKAVSQAKDYFLANKNGEYLWNAKPRFGKTLSSYDLCKRLNAKKVLIVTNRPAIANSWYDDYVKFFGTESGYYFVSDQDTVKNKKYVVSREKYIEIMKQDENCKGCIEFVSLQALKRSLYFGGGTDNLKEIVDLEWDILIIDEAHEGVDTYKTDVAFDRINRKYTLHLSGTPFKALANDKFKENAIYNWTYADEQEAKRNWDNSSEEENPYANLPQLNLFTYKMSDIVIDKLQKGADFDNDGENENYAFDLNEFFKTNESGNFIHNNEVDKFLDALVSQEKFPFSTQELRDELKHTLWLLKYVSSAKALKKKLETHSVFGYGNYKIVLVAGDVRLNNEADLNDDNADQNIKNAFDKVKDAIKNNERTITISVGQLTTGITIPEWTAVMMLSNVKSPALYMQAAFRAQNPCLFDGANGQKLRKENAYVFDFDPARTLTIIEDFANGLHSDTANGKGDSAQRKEHVRELLNFFPVYGEDPNGEMISLDAEKVLTIPRTIHAKEVVRCGFMNNFLFQNIGNIFNAPKEVRDMIQKFEPVKQDLGIKQNTKKDLNLDNEGNVNIPEETVIGTANTLFGEKIYDSLEDDLIDFVDNFEQETESKKDKQELDCILDIFHTKTNNLINTAKESYGTDMSKSTKLNAERKINAETDLFIKKEYSNLQIENNKLENQKQQEIKQAQESNNFAQIENINKTYEKKKEENTKIFKETIKSNVNKIVENAGKTIARVVETSKKEKERNEIIDNVKAHLRGFSRTIPSFIMGYGDENTTIENFDKIIPNEVFKEVTSISLEEFKKLRDGFDYIDENGNNQHYSGFFDIVVFNDSIKEFLALKDKLSNYFDENQKEDIFDYIPPQKTNQIFTPKKVVKEMVDNLEKENPGCFDDQNNTFIDLYMKSGLYITEIVKRLYRSSNMKKLYPNDADRLNHIFEKQVYGLAPTEIIYRIAKSFILGFDKDIKIAKHNLKQFDSLPSAQDGTLEQKLDEVFRD